MEDGFEMHFLMCGWIWMGAGGAVYSIPYTLPNLHLHYYQCFGSGSGSGWIRIIWPDPDPLQETFIRIRVVKK